MNQFEEIRHKGLEKIADLNSKVHCPIFKSEDLKDKEVYTLNSLAKAKEDFEDRINKALSEDVDVKELIVKSEEAQKEIDALSKGILLDSEGNKTVVFYRDKVEK